MRAPPSDGPRVVSWIAMIARRLDTLSEQNTTCSCSLRSISLNMLIGGVRRLFDDSGINNGQSQCRQILKGIQERSAPRMIEVAQSYVALLRRVAQFQILLINYLGYCSIQFLRKVYDEWFELIKAKSPNPRKVNCIRES